MEKYLVSARKYRPDTFNSVVGQTTVTTTLKNSIKNNQLAHAYLFCGPHGVGKTTCARVFAKTINCYNITEEIEPCNECISCKSYNEGRSFSIHELDAASNNSVEDIRNLIEHVHIPPQIGKYSVYIIDEVHMLSQAAFNAFLKTLEEPPSHTIFILATTEKHKIIPTILSRCQVFDFSRITVNDIVKHLENIAQKENINYEVDALNIIAQKVNGSLRNALSIFDQISNFTNGNITYDAVIQNLNILDYSYYFKFIEFFLNNNIGDALLYFDDILRKGFDPHNFIIGLMQHFRDLLVSKNQLTVKLLEYSDNIKQQYLNQAQKVSDEFIYEALNILNECDLNYKNSKNQRLLVEITLLKLCNLNTEKKNNISEVKQEFKTDNQLDKTRSEFNNKISSKDSKTSKTETATPTQIPSIKGSINKILSKNGNFQEKDALKNLREPFTIEELQNLWFSYVESIKEEKPRMYLILSKKSFEFDNKNNLIKIGFISKVQQDEFEIRIKAELLDFLRKNLRNYSIEIESFVNEQPNNDEKRPYTVEERYKYLLQKNPLIEQLRKDFGMEIE